MENILVRGKKNISKVFILALIFIGLISAFSMVNAADEKITLKVGEEKEIKLGIIETLWGGIKDIQFKTEAGGGTTSIKYSKTGTETFFYGGQDITLTANKVGNYKMTVVYQPDFWRETTKTYDITVVAGVNNISILNMTKVKKSYNIGDAVDLSNLTLVVSYTDGHDENVNVSEMIKTKEDQGRVKYDTISYSPKTISKDTKKITITYKDEYGVKEEVSYDINVKTQNPVTPQQPTQSEGNNQKPSDTSNSQPETKVYTNKLTVGDKLKLKSGSGWKKYKSKSINSAYKTMTGGTTFTIEAIDGNWLTIKGESTYKYLYYGPEASSYFSRVTTTSNSSNSSNSSSTANTTNTTAPQYSNGTAVKEGDSIKMTKGNSWNVYSDSSCKTIKTYIQASKGLTYKVESISGNILKISQAGKEVGYIKWYNSNTGARSYFSNVGTSASVETGTKVETQQGTSTEVVSQTMNILVKLIETLLKSVLEGMTTTK